MPDVNDGAAHDADGIESDDYLWTKGTFGLTVVYLLEENVLENSNESL